MTGMTIGSCVADTIRAGASVRVRRTLPACRGLGSSRRQTGRRWLRCVQRAAEQQVTADPSREEAVQAPNQPRRDQQKDQIRKEEESIDRAAIEKKIRAAK